MVQYLEKYKQNIAIDMRKRGFSYSEIENRLHIPKSTLSYWLKGIKLTPEQIQKFSDRRTEAAKQNALKKISKTRKMIEEIRNSSAKDVKEISKKELWLMGVVLYWKNGNKSDLKKGVHFSSSDPAMIKLFLEWLKEVGGIQDKEIRFDIFVKGNKAVSKVVEHWSRVTKFPRDYFSKVYCQKQSTKRGSNYGFLRVRVAQSSMLARQISGWIEGIKNLNNT